MVGNMRLIDSEERRDFEKNDTSPKILNSHLTAGFPHLSRTPYTEEGGQRRPASVKHRLFGPSWKTSLIFKGQRGDSGQTNVTMPRFINYIPNGFEPITAESIQKSTYLRP